MSNISIYRFALDMTPGGVTPVVHLSQYDDAFQLEFTLYSRTGELNIPSGATAMIEGTKLDGKAYSANAAISGNVVTVTGDVQISAVAGNNPFQIVLKSGNSTIGSANFTISVERAALDYDTVSDSKLAQIQDVSGTAAQLTAAAENVTDGVETFEALAESVSDMLSDIVDDTLSVSGKAADAAKTGEELSNLKSDSVHGTNQNLTSTTGTDICNDDLNNLPLNVVYGIVPYSGLTHMPYTETGSEYGGIIFSVSKQYPANATATQILIRRDGHVFTRQYWNSWESWFEYVTYSEITALVDNYVALAFFGSEQNITSTTVQSICSGDANNLPNNRIMGINIAYNGITNLPTDYPDGIKSKYGGCVITFGKQSSRGYGDTQIFVGYGSQTYIRVYTGSWQNWRCLSTQKFNNIVGVGDSICEGWRNYNKGFVGWLNVPYTNLGVTGATLGFAAGHTQIYTEIENITYTKDVIISDGGINDYYFDVPLGDQPTRPVTNDTEASSIDKSTVSGGLSYLCYLMITKMPKAQRYFLITHKTNNYPYTANGAGYTQQQLHDRIVEVCKLYNVHIIDVYEQSIINSAFSQYVSPTAYASDTSVTTQYYVDSDGIHPLALGYQEGYYPIIRQALQSATTKI